MGGEQWIGKQYPEQLKAIRHKKNAYLIVVIDVDTGNVENRHKELETACTEEGIPLRGHKKDANVLHIIPRRDIETWLAYLGGMNVDKSTVYPKPKNESNYKEHERSLYNMCHRDQKLRESALPFLQEARNEYHKLTRVLDKETLGEVLLPWFSALRSLMGTGKRRKREPYWGLWFSLSSLCYRGEGASKIRQRLGSTFRAG